MTGTDPVSFLTVTDHTTVGLFTTNPVGEVARSDDVAAVPKDPGTSPEEIEKRIAEQEAFGDGLLADDARTLYGHPLPGRQHHRGRPDRVSSPALSAARSERCPLLDCAPRNESPRARA